MRVLQRFTLIVFYEKILIWNLYIFLFLVCNVIIWKEIDFVHGRVNLGTNCIRLEIFDLKKWKRGKITIQVILTGIFLMLNILFCLWNLDRSQLTIHCPRNVNLESIWKITYKHFIYDSFFLNLFLKVVYFWNLFYIEFIKLSSFYKNLNNLDKICNLPL